MPSLNNEEMKKVYPAEKIMKQAQSTKSNDQLCKNYQISVDYLAQYEYIIKTLQHQLASKDETIKRLEEKLVQMSLDLASSKALEDEHQLLTRKLMGDSYHGSDDGAECPAPPQVDKKGQGADILQSLASETRYAPASKRVVGRNTHPSRKSCAAFSQSWTGHSPLVPAGDRKVNARNVPTSARSGSAVEVCKPEQLRSQQHSRQNSLGVPYSAQTINVNCVPSSAEYGSALGLNRHEKLRSQHYTRQSSFRESFSARKLSDIGQYLLGLNKNDTSEVASAEGDANDAFPRRLGQKRKSSHQSSSGSLISGVVFPHSSRDVLVACLLDEASGSKSAGNANVEWPEF